MKKILSALHLFLAVMTLALVIPAQAQTGQDDLAKRVASYELTMARMESYGKVTAALADWASANPAAAKALNNRMPKTITSVPESAALLEAEPVIKKMLDEHRLSGNDYVLMPSAIMQAQIAVLGESQGRSFPADKINPKNIALVKTNMARVDEIMLKVRADRVRAFGQ
ncbi:MAG: hypothetical protein QG652_198 [Pseudomonadota bacterium]|nr:hypothetical protein [Pseudomonadota bacterium]